MSAKATAKVKTGRSVDPIESADAPSPKPVDTASLFARTMKRYPKTMARLAE